MTGSPAWHSVVAATACCLTATAVGMATGCGTPEIFASVRLLVREPAATERMESNPTTLVLDIDGASKRVTFATGAELQSDPIVLGDVERRITPFVIVGEPAIAFGSGDPFTIPAVADAVGTSQIFDRPLIVAAPNVAELLDATLPPPRSAMTVCSDAAHAWFFGGIGVNGEMYLDGYAFRDQELIGSSLQITDLVPGALACDGMGDGSFFLVEGGCEEQKAPRPARLSVGDETRVRQVRLARTLCAPRVGVVEGHAWVASRGRVERFTLDTEFTSGPALDMDGLEPRAVLALSAQLVLVASELGIFVVRAVGDAVTSARIEVEEPIDFARSSVHGSFVLTRKGAVLRIDDDGEIGDGRVPNLRGVSPEQLELLPDGRAVILGREGLVIEGSSPTQRTVDGLPVRRDRMAVTVGGAVILVGGDVAGIDVVVPPPRVP